MLEIWSRTSNSKDNHRSFDYGSRDEAARAFAQDDNFMEVRCFCPPLDLVDGAAGGDELLGFEGDGAEGLLVLGEVVVEDVGEGFGLLGAEIDSLEVGEVDLFGGVLGHGSEDEEEVPYAHADLDAVGVAFAIVGGGG
jgi:hypothetical protein